MNSNDIPDASALLDVLIVRAVRGEASPWPIDPHLDFKWKGSFEATFEAGKGDKQILLWEINDCAQRGARIPKWAADALYDIMLNGVARGDFDSWEDAFGPIRSDQHRTIQPRRHMVAVWTFVRKLHGEGCKDWEKLYDDAAKKYGIGIGKVKEYYQDMQRFMEKHGSDVCMELKRKSIRD